VNDIKWEVVRTDAGWHLRMKAGNGEIILSTETYNERRDAVHALNLVTASVIADQYEFLNTPAGLAYVEVDERGQS
jgi:uncharacterized protein YegP (UPF0339 family)